MTSAPAGKGRYLSRQLPRFAGTAHSSRVRANCCRMCEGWSSARWIFRKNAAALAGTFSVKFADVSGGMARTKIDAIQRTGRRGSGVSIDSSCLMQLQGVMSRDGVPVKTLHLAEVLASR